MTVQKKAKRPVILFLEDEPLHFKAIAKALRWKGYSCLRRGTIKIPELEELVQAWHPKRVVLDVWLSTSPRQAEEWGTTFVKPARDADRNLRVIVYSQKAEDQGQIDFVAKSWRAHKGIVKRTVNGRITPAEARRIADEILSA